MDLTGQFVLVLLYQGAIVADLSELSHPQALSNYDNGEATVDFAVSNGFGITEPSAVFHLSGWDLDYNPQQSIDFSLKASSLSDSGPHLEPDILGTVENQETYSPLVNLINIEDTGKDISTNKLIINSTNKDRSRKQSKYKHGLLKSLNLVLNEIHYQESRLDTEHRNPTVLSAIQPSPTDVFTRSFSKSTNSSRNIKTSQSSFSLLKNALQKSVVSKENRTSALDHSRRFRELTKRRKYSMNFVKRENINGSENVFDLTTSNITFGITELQENISLGFIRNSKIPFVDIFGVSSINNYTHPSESQTAHQFVDEDLLNTLNYSDFKLERAPMINNNSNNHLLDTNIELNKGTSTLSRLKNSSSIISPNKTLSSPSFTYLGYLPVPTSSHPPTKESTLFSNGGTTRVTLSSSSMGPDNIHVPGVLPMPLTTTSLPRPTLSTLFSLKPTSTSDPWPVKLAAEIPGDLILGGLMMVHEREDSVTCGPIMPQGGIQALETMLYTLDVVNNMPDAPFTLGAHILDDCDKDTYGLEMAVDFIKEGQIDVGIITSYSLFLTKNPYQPCLPRTTFSYSLSKSLNLK
ncbi:hypothetical protein J6590_066193 [Homalodisca vitripennis]|nr:hypothetical protein J6590_066193 [Homalodisca vitripennis]